MTACDILLLYPVEGPAQSMDDPDWRSVFFGHYVGPVLEAKFDFEAKVGLPLDLAHPTHKPLFGGQPMPIPRTRTAGAVVLSGAVERAGLTWRTIDPGTQGLTYWRKKLAELRQQHLSPRTIGVSTTFAYGPTYSQGLLSLVREYFPNTPIIIGGYYYASNAQAFLSLDADVYCIGEGDVRLPEIVKALIAGSSLDGIPGLYLPNASGGLRYTGRAEPLNLSQLPLPDWTLSRRIEPTIDMERESMEMIVETQRGCVFKCGFCTLRTLVSPNTMTEDVAVEALLTAPMRFGGIMVADATATYPHDRWKTILREVIKRGGAPLPIWLYARVNDIDEEMGALMATAGVKHVFIGQESGHQAVLNAMRKGTNVKNVGPAAEVLARNGISATFGMIHGYPGENRETIEATRNLLLTVNDANPERPPVIFYALNPLLVQDLAGSVHEQGLEVVDKDSMFGYQLKGMKPSDWAKECTKTFIAVSRRAHAPAHFSMYGRAALNSNAILLAASPHRTQIYRWMKLVERGTGIMLAHPIEGATPKQGEIDELRRQLETFYDERTVHAPWVRTAATRVVSRGLTRVLRQVKREAQHESLTKEPGPITRLAVGALSWQVKHSVRHAVEAAREGALVYERARHAQQAEVNGTLADLAKIMVDEGLDNGRKRLKIVDRDGQVQPSRATARAQPE